MRSAIRDARWLGGDRALAWARVLAAGSVLAILGLFVASRFGTAPDPFGRPVATDFSSFWTAGRLALAGLPAAAWHPAAHAALQHASFPPAAGFQDAYYAFFYPPPFLLVCLPFALLPYGAAAALWIVLTGLACFAAVRRLLPRFWPAAVVFLAFPAVLINAGQGQNGALSAALFAAAALSLDRRPGLAGVCLGALCYKPQLGLLILPALLAGRRWRALFCGAATVACLCILSLVAFGPGAWRGFWADCSLARHVLAFGGVGFAKMVSPFAGARLLGAGLGFAWAIQALVSLAACLAVVAVARRRPGGQAEIAVLVAAATLATPFLLDYDLLVLAVPLAWMASEAGRTSYLAWEKAVLGIAFLLPLFVRVLAMGTGVPLAPFVLAALLWAVLRRAGAPTAAPRPDRDSSGSFAASAPS